MNQKKRENKSKTAKKAVPVSTDPGVYNKLKNTLGIIIAIFAFMLYAQSISFNYALDDGTVVQENSLTTKGLSGIPQILKTDYWYGVNIRVPQYRPASLVLFAIEWQFFHKDPHAYHFVNILLYALTCWLLFKLLCKLFGKQNLIFPFVCTLLFTAHPLHTEVVDNIKSGDEIICFLFALFAVYLYIKYIERKSISSLFLASPCYFVSITSKETGFAYLFLIPITLFVFTKASKKEIMITVSTLAAGTALYLLIRALVLDHFLYHPFDTRLRNSLSAAPDALSQKATEFYVLLKYILLLVFPYPLSYDYSFAQIPIQKIGDPAVLLSIIIYLAIGIYAILKIRKKNYVAFAILFYLLTLFPVSNLLLLTGSPMSERFTYMPSLGFCMLLTFLLIRLTRTDTLKGRFTSFKVLLSANKSVFLVVFILTGIYSIRALARSPDWKDDITLFGHDVAIADKSAKAHYRWGFTLFTKLYPDATSKEEADAILNKANTEFLKTIGIASEYAEAYSHLSMINEKFNQLDKALAYSDSAVKYLPNSLGTHADKGFVCSRAGRYAEAIAEYQTCLKIDPKFDLAYKNIGICYRNLNENAKAIDYLLKAMELDPNDPKNMTVLANAYQGIGDAAKAKFYFEKANQLKVGP